MNNAKLRRILQSVWMLWEKGFDLYLRVSSKKVLDYGICKLILKKHRGSCLQCEDGSWIHTEDWIGELHINNHRIRQMLGEVSPERAALKTARLGRKALQRISNDLYAQPELGGIKALMGITLLHRGIIYGSGFELRPLKPGLFRILTTKYLRLLLRIMHPQGNQRIDGSEEKLHPKLLIFSKNSIMLNYPPQVVRKGN